MTTKTFTEMIESSVSQILKGVGTSIPGHVLSFDPDTQLAKVQIGVEFVKADGETFTIAPIVNVPVHFPGGDFAIEYQIDQGNEGLILVSQRCIDGWKEQGGVASQPILRKLDMQDSLFIPGFRSKPGALSAFQNNGVRLRNKDASHYIWLKNDSTAEIKIPTLNIIGNIVHTGNTTQAGTVALTGDMTQAGNTIKTGNVTNIGTTTINGGLAQTPGSGSSSLGDIITDSIVVNGVEVDGHDHLAGTEPGDVGVMK